MTTDTMTTEFVKALADQGIESDYTHAGAVWVQGLPTNDTIYAVAEATQVHARIVRRDWTEEVLVWLSPLRYERKVR